MAISQINSASGTAPDFGAIFMSNKATIEECFERKLFGLPRAFVNFVRGVKAGMVLFLFEYENRKLHGVFEAVMDGKVDIEPRAYCSSGKLFPAQVRFDVIWNCHPLSERDFRSAIRENYFTAYKFNFGLSKDQVGRLMCLFYSRKIRVQRSLRKKQVNERHLKSSDKAKPLVSSAKLGQQIEDSMVYSQATYSTSAAGSSSFPGTQSVRLQEESQDVKSFSSCTTLASLGNYIPLDSPEHFDSTSTGKASTESGNLGDDQLESATFDAYKDQSFSEACIVPMPFGFGGRNQPHPQSDNTLKVKGLYSDTAEKRKSVFSRLNLVKTSIEQNKHNSGGTESVHEVMEKLRQSYSSWNEATRKTKSIGHGKARKIKSVTHEKANVFARLKLAPNDGVERKEVNMQQDNLMSRTTETLSGEKKRRLHQVRISSHDDFQKFKMAIHMNMSDEVKEDPNERRSRKQKMREGPTSVRELKIIKLGSLKPM